MCALVPAFVAFTKIKPIRLLQRINKANDADAVSVMKGRETIGHDGTSYKNFRMCTIFRIGRYIKYTVTGSRCYSRDLATQ